MTDDERERAFKAALRKLTRGNTDLQRNTRDEIVRQLKAALAKIEATLGAAPTDYQLWSLPRLMAEIRQVLNEFGDSAAAQISTAAGRAWQLGADTVDTPFAAAGVGIRAVLPAISTRQLLAMRAFATDRIKDIAVQAMNKINTELGLVVIGAQAPGNAVGAVRNILGEPSRARATTIVRTSLGQVFSVAGFNRMQDAAARVPGLQKQWRRSGKVHPRLHHFIADGQIRDVDKPFELRPLGQSPVHLMYPLDPKAPAGEVINCGCVSLPYMAGWANLQNALSQPGRSNAPVADNLDAGPTMSELLDRQPASAPVARSTASTSRRSKEPQS